MYHYNCITRSVMVIRICISEVGWIHPIFFSGPQSQFKTSLRSCTRFVDRRPNLLGVPVDWWSLSHPNCHVPRLEMYRQLTLCRTGRHLSPHYNCHTPIVTYLDYYFFNLSQLQIIFPHVELSLIPAIIIFSPRGCLRKKRSPQFSAPVVLVCLPCMTRRAFLCAFHSV